jgi:hypothetical protein
LVINRSRVLFFLVGKFTICSNKQSLNVSRKLLFRSLGWFELVMLPLYVNSKNIELVAVKVQLSKQKPLIVGSYYRPPNRTDNEYLNHIICISLVICLCFLHLWQWCCDWTTNIFYICDVMILVLQVYTTVNIRQLNVY